LTRKLVGVLRVFQRPAQREMTPELVVNTRYSYRFIDGGKDRKNYSEF
jgi:hypothetical protein